MSATQTVSQTTLTTSAPQYTGPIETEINFFVPPADGSKPYNWVHKQPEGVPQSNYGVEARKVTVKDIRGREADFKLDAHGFAAVKATTSPEVDFWSDESIKEKYYPEVEALLKKEIPGTHKVIIFDHTLRRHNSDRTPVLRAHIDQTARAAALRVPLHVTDKEESDRLLKGRYRIVNVWRPLGGPVESHPLAVGDSQTFPEENLIPVEHRYPDRTGETASVSYHPGVQWYYLGAMRDDERLLLQCFDSGSPARVPHTAIADPRSTAASKPRESIEVRCLVFGDN